MELRTMMLAMLFLSLGSVVPLILVLLVVTMAFLLVTYAQYRRPITESHSSSSSPSSDLAGTNYDVFLSFRGRDTREGFTDILYKRLTDAGINVYDNDGVPVGKDIRSVLIEAIKGSKVLIAIISRNYASSPRCLMELVQILECKKNMNREIIPIFFEIEPSDVRDQKYSFEKSFLEHERNGVDSETIKKWRLTLKEIGSLKGFQTREVDNGHYSILIDELIPIVCQKLQRGRLHVTKHLVGVDDHVQEIMRKLCVLYRNKQVNEICGSDVRVLGIYGMGGVGKTTLAKVVYNQLYDRFQGYSYLSEMRGLHQHDRMLSLQNKLISDLKKGSVSFRSSDDAMKVLAEVFRNKQVLILLDDVQDVDQLAAVVGELSWFGPGSRIIVTSRRSDILLKFKEAEIYEVEPMEEDKALQLFSKCAFGRDSPSEGFESLSREIISATGRLPLALVATGSCLFRQLEGTWKDMLMKLKDAPHEKVAAVLKMSYDALDEYEKQIFLDIACFLIGKDERIAVYMWEDRKLYPYSSGIEALLVMCLVKIGENNEFLMHDPLRTLGRNIVLNEDPTPCNRSRLWMHNEALSTLRKKEGTEKVKALCLNFQWHTSDKLTPEDFKSMPNLRFLQLDHADIAGDFANVFPNLRWLCWRGCPRHLQVTNFHLGSLTILDLSCSKVTKDWEGWDQIEMKNLRVLDLTGCADLLVTPKFSGCTNLAMLILERCSQLVKIHHSIRNLECLVSLNLKFCPELSMLPVQVGHLTALKELLMDGTSIQEIPVSIGYLKQLETLSASNCFSLSQLPRTIHHLMNITLLSLEGSIITALPNSIGELVRLKHLSLRDCRQIRKLPSSIGNIGRSLVELDVSGTGVFKFPDSLKNLQNLKVLRMDSCFFREFPPDIGELTSLEEIHASWCRSLEGGIPSKIGKLHNLRILRLQYSSISSIPAEIHQLSNLQTLDLLNCNMIKELPRLPSSIMVLHVDDELKSSHLP